LEFEERRNAQTAPARSEFADLSSTLASKTLGSIDAGHRSRILIAGGEVFDGRRASTPAVSAWPVKTLVQDAIDRC
jgi:hypothetical protein